MNYQLLKSKNGNCDSSTELKTQWFSRNKIYKLLILLIVLFLLNILIVTAEYKTNITEIKCYTDASVKVNTLKADTEYIIENCKIYKNNIWKCSCNNDLTPIALVSKNTTKDIFDVVVEYYISNNINDDNKRTLFFNNININYKEPKKEFVWPEIKSSVGLIIGIIIIILLIGGLLISFLLKIFFHDNVISEQKINNTKLTEEDEENIENIMNDL